MKKKKKLIIIIAVVLVLAAVAAVVLLRMKGKDDDGEGENPIVPAPIEYRLDKETSVVALPVGTSIEVREEKPEKEDKKAEDEEESASSEDAESASTDEEREEGPAITVSVTYHYKGFSGHIERIKNYCDLLMAEDFGFVPVDEKVMKTKLPSFEKLAGTACLVRPVGAENASEESSDEGGESESLFMIQLQWNVDDFSVTVGEIEGGIVAPPAPKPMTLTEAVDYFHTLIPSVLGLEGETMDNYQVLALDGAVLVGTTPCLRMNVYKKDEKTGTNGIAGQYLFSNTGRELYWVGLNGEITQVLP